MKYLLTGFKDLYSKLTSRIAKDIYIFLLTVIGMFSAIFGLFGLLVAPGWISVGMLIFGTLSGIMVRGYYLVMEGKA